MRNLLSSEYFPFGSQYYRAPSPRPDQWEGDLRRMHELGFNSIKYWAQWRWNHPAPDQFYWDDLDRLMDLAAEHDLRVMLNTIVDVAPAWVYRDYPDASMVTLDGRQIGPQTQPHRQIGGLGVCLCHEEVMDHLFNWLRACIERYSDHPALEIWNVGSEPELTQSMAEMRLYADDAAKMGDMLDYNPHSVRAFRQWLSEKYDGDLDELNKRWNRNYRSFDEAEVPKTRNTFNDVVDWRMFFVHVLGEHVKRRFDVAAEVDQGKHPLMCHHVFIQGFPITSTASDPWNVGRFGDLHGFTQMDDAMMCDILRSCARGKPVISAEMLMLYGYTLDLPRPIRADDIKRHVFTGLAAEQKGFIFWQYRPETLGREAPAWGLSHLDGASTPWLEDFAEVGRVCRDNASFFLDAKPAPTEIAILYHPENQIFTWASTGNEKNATDSLLGVHGALYKDSYNVAFIHPREFSDELLDQFKVIVLPFPYWIGGEVAEALKAWVQRGGMLIAEAYCGGWFVEEGRHHTTIPGYGLHEVFGVRQKNGEPAMDGQDFIELTTTRALPGLPEGAKLYGTLARETFFVETAEVLATYADGEAAVTRATYGEGQAILIGSYLALPGHRHGHASNAAFFAALVTAFGGVDRPQIEGNGKVRVDVMTHESEALVILRNLETHPVEASVRVRMPQARTLRELFSDETLSLTRADDHATLTVRLAPEQVKGYRSE